LPSSIPGKEEEIRLSPVSRGIQEKLLELAMRATEFFHHISETKDFIFLLSILMKSWRFQ